MGSTGVLGASRFYGSGQEYQGSRVFMMGSEGASGLQGRDQGAGSVCRRTGGQVGSARVIRGQAGSAGGCWGPGGFDGLRGACGGLGGRNQGLFLGPPTPSANLHPHPAFYQYLFAWLPALANVDKTSTWSGLQNRHSGKAGWSWVEGGREEGLKIA